MFQLGAARPVSLAPAAVWPPLRIQPKKPRSHATPCEDDPPRHAQRLPTAAEALSLRVILGAWPRCLQPRDRIAGGRVRNHILSAKTWSKKIKRDEKSREKGEKGENLRDFLHQIPSTRLLRRPLGTRTEFTRHAPEALFLRCGVQRAGWSAPLLASQPEAFYDIVCYMYICYIIYAICYIVLIYRFPYAILLPLKGS